METDTTNYFNLSICLISLFSVHLFCVWQSIRAFKKEKEQKPKKKKSK